MPIALKDICAFQSGGTPSKSNPEYFNGSIPWITTVALNGRTIGEYDAVDWITDKAIQESAAKIVPAQSIMVGTRVGVGKVAVNSVPMSTSQDIISLVGIDENRWSKDYICKFIQSKGSFLLAQARGATIKGIKIDVLAGLQVPEIALEEQRRIVRTLEHLLDCIDKRQKQLDTLDQLIKARFVEMFGDPVSNPFGLPEKKLSELGTLDRGRSQHRPRNAPELLGGPYPLIQTGEVSSAGLYITEYHNTYSETGLKQSKMWKAGTLCITIAANIAQTAIMTFDACFPDSVVGFVPYNEVNALYVHYWFGFFQKILEEQAPQVAQKNINLKILSDLEVIVPKQEDLLAFESFVTQVDKSKVVDVMDRLGLLRLASA